MSCPGGDKVLVLESGKFAVDWGDAAAHLGLQVEVLKGDWHHAVRPAEVEHHLRQDRAGTIKAILALQIDTSTGVVNDIAAIGQAVKAAQHEALLMVDTVASLGCMPFAMDAWGIDVAMAGSQKGLMTPPGLGFVAAGRRAARPTARPVCARPIGTGVCATASRTIRNMPALRRCI
jgi:alanine-glyoxylate transaminase / serine-glyoxylate transaminase / serine-pyruvate transaminase